MQADRAAVLVVNANPGLRMLLDALLAGAYTLELAADTTAGLARLAGGGIDLVPIPLHQLTG